MTAFTEEEVKRAYQLGYSHGANGLPPLDGPQVLRVVEPGQVPAEPAGGKRE